MISSQSVHPPSDHHHSILNVLSNVSCGPDHAEQRNSQVQKENDFPLKHKGEEATLLPLGVVCFSRLIVKYCKVNLEFALPTPQN